MAGARWQGGRKCERDVRFGEPVNECWLLSPASP